MCDLYAWPNAELLFLASMLHNNTKHAWPLCKKKAYSGTKLWTAGSKNIKIFYSTVAPQEQNFKHATIFMSL